MTSVANNQRAIKAMIVSQATFALSDTMVKLATSQLPPGEIMAIRGGLSLSILLVATYFLGNGASLARLGQPVVLLRSGLEAMISLAFVLSIAVMPIANYTAIIQSTPLIITAISVMLYAANVGWRRWSAIFVGFAGVLLVAKPESGGFGYGALLAVLCAVLVAARDIITPRIPAMIPSFVVTLSTTITTTILGTGITLTDSWVAPDWLSIGELAVAALGVTAGNFCIISACRDCDLSLVAPFRYSVMPFALLSGFLVWGNVPDVWAAIGIVLICGSGIYAFYRERLRAKSSANR